MPADEPGQVILGNTDRVIEQPRVRQRALLATEPKQRIAELEHFWTAQAKAARA